MLTTSSSPLPASPYTCLLSFQIYLFIFHASRFLSRSFTFFFLFSFEILYISYIVFFLLVLYLWFLSSAISFFPSFLSHSAKTTTTIFSLSFVLSTHLSLLLSIYIMNSSSYYFFHNFYFSPLLLFSSLCYYLFVSFPFLLNSLAYSQHSFTTLLIPSLLPHLSSAQFLYHSPHPPFTHSFLPLNLSLFLLLLIHYIYYTIQSTPTTFNHLLANTAIYNSSRHPPSIITHSVPPLPPLL